jgi:hypothetical protein
MATSRSSGPCPSQRCQATPKASAPTTGRTYIVSGAPARGQVQPAEGETGAQVGEVGQRGVVAGDKQPVNELGTGGGPGCRRSARTTRPTAVADRPPATVGAPCGSKTCTAIIPISAIPRATSTSITRPGPAGNELALITALPMSRCVGRGADRLDVTEQPVTPLISSLCSFFSTWFSHRTPFVGRSLNDDENRGARQRGKRNGRILHCALARVRRVRGEWRRESSRHRLRPGPRVRR